MTAEHVIAAYLLVDTVVGALTLACVVWMVRNR